MSLIGLSADPQGSSIYTSTDSGATWTEQTGTSPRAWISISASDNGTNLTALVSGASIYTSTDSGATWTERIVSGTRGWFALVGSTDGIILAAVAGYNFIYTSTDSGATWTERTAAGARNWIGITISDDGTKLAAVDRGGYIYTSTDSGATWTERTSAGSRLWWSMAGSVDGSKLVAITVSGTENYIYTSTDSGATWTERTAAGSHDWESVAMSDDGNIIFAGTDDDSGLWRSNDAGSTWSHVNVGLTTSAWYGLAMTPDASTIIAVDVAGPDWNGGYVYISHDSGTTWTAVTSLGMRYWKDYGGPSVAISDDGKKIALLDMYGTTWNDWNGGYIYISMDGGATWQEETSLGYDGWTSVTMSADGTKLAVSSELYQRHIYTATLTQPTLTFTPSTTDPGSYVPPASTNPSAPQTITETQPTFTGTTYPNSPVTVTVNSDPIVCTTTSDSQGNWSCTLPSTIPPGTHTVTIELTNPDTNQTEQLGPYYVEVLGDSTITIDSNTPLVPNTGVAGSQLAPTAHQPVTGNNQTTPFLWIAIAVFGVLGSVVLGIFAIRK